MLSLSTLLELIGFGLLVEAIRELAGRPAAFIAAAVILVLIGLAVEGTSLSLRQRLSAGLARVASALRRDEVEDDEPDS